MTDHHIKDTLTLDLPEGLLECEATYRIRAEWYRGELLSASCSLVSFRIGKAAFPPPVADRILGADAVVRQERIVGDRWCETAERDHALAVAEDRQALLEGA